MPQTDKGVKRLNNLPTPAFVINRFAMQKNCQAALEFVETKNMSIRPHIKTHKTHQGILLQAGTSSRVTGFVASTLPEIELLVKLALEQGAPYNDILFGVPIAASKLGEIDSLQDQLSEKGTIHVLVDHLTQLQQIEAHCRAHRTQGPYSVFLKLDTGYHRAGVPCDERGVSLAYALLQSKCTHLVGVYSHCGHAYDENDPSLRDAIALKDAEQIGSFLDLLDAESQQRNAQNSSNDLIVSVGSTPSMSHHYRIPRLINHNKMEIHPGNYTLYDRQQLWTGACPSKESVAGRVLCKVLSHYPDRGTILLDAGALALTKESTPQGGMCEITGHPQLECHRTSQEVTLVRTKDGSTFPFVDFPIGSVVSLLPNHSCLAAACFDRYYIIHDTTCAFDPEQEVVDEWVPAKYFTTTA